MQLLKQFFWFSWVYIKTCKNLVLQYLKLLFIFLSAVDSDDDDEDDEDERLCQGLFEKKRKAKNVLRIKVEGRLNGVKVY